MYLLPNLLETQRKLLAGENVSKGFVEFDLMERGRRRHIKSIHISERVTQKCLCDQVLVPILTKGLIYDNGASQRGKGTHFALRRLIGHLTQYYRRHNFSNEGYALLIDFSKFFDSIDHRILFDLLAKKIKDERVLELTKGFIRVFGNGKSLGLGSQVSQICAIYYPDRLDHYIKETLQIKYYGRYMDDMYLIHESKDYLQQCLKTINKICGDLRITINTKKTRIVQLSQGVDFLKGRYTLLPTGKILRRPHKDSAERMRRKLKKFRALIGRGRMGLEDLRAAYQSWRGNYRKRFDAYYGIRRIDRLYNALFTE